MVLERSKATARNASEGALLISNLYVLSVECGDGHRSPIGRNAVLSLLHHTAKAVAAEVWACSQSILA